jgi:hypothetical protein
MKGSPTEVMSLMHSMLHKDLIDVIEKKKEDLLKRDNIIKSIGSTYLDWIHHVSQRFLQTKEDCFYLDNGMFYSIIYQDLYEIARDICFINKDLKITYVGDGEDDCNILFTHNNGFHILIYITQSYFGMNGSMDIHVRAGTNIDVLYDGLY